MGEIVNLKRAKKAKARTEKEIEAAGNRVKFGAPKPLRKLAKARVEKEMRDIDAHKKDD